MIRVVLVALLRRRRALAWLVVWSLPEALPIVLSGYAIAHAVDQGFLTGRPATGLAWLGVLALAVLVGACATRRSYRRLTELVEPFRDDLVEHVVTGALRRCGIAGRPVDPGAVSRLTHQVEIVRDTFAGWIMTLRSFGFALVAALLGMLSLAPVVVLLIAPPLVVGLASFAATVPVMMTRQRAYVCADERLADSTGEASAALRDIVACGAEERVAASVGARVDAQARAERSIATMAALRSLILAISGYLPLVVLLVGAPSLIRRGVSVGAVLGALTYVLHGLQPALHTLMRGIGAGGLRLAVTLDRILGPGDENASASSAGPATPAGRVVPARAELVLRGVTFRYGPHAEPVLTDLDLVVDPDDHLAIVGPSGIGKSTLAALLAGTLRPQAGEIRLGGVPLDRLDAVTLARHRVLIPQEAYVFTGTLLDNLTYLRPDAVLGDVAAAAEAVGLRPLVRRLGGYHAGLDPRALSAGERQLVALTRAYLSPAPLVLLDEATCHLDPAAESRAERAFADRPGSLVVIAHRVSSALRARRILVLDGTGALVGSHDDLLEGSALYRDIVGHWRPGPPPPMRSLPPDHLQPAGLLGDADGLQPAAATGLAQDDRHVVAHRSDREVQPVGDLSGR